MSGNAYTDRGRGEAEGRVWEGRAWEGRVREEAGGTGVNKTSKGFQREEGKGHTVYFL